MNLQNLAVFIYSRRCLVRCTAFQVRVGILPESFCADFKVKVDTCLYSSIHSPCIFVNFPFMDGDVPRRPSMGFTFHNLLDLLESAVM